MLRAMSGKAAYDTPVSPHLDDPVLEHDTPAAAAILAAVWIDLLDPTETERAIVERHTGLHLPSQAEISEIENSSRLAAQGGILTLSTPMVSRGADGTVEVAPIGFVLSPDRLVTLRFAPSIVFDHVSEHWRETEACGHASMQAFLALLEAIVDRLADVLERVGAELDAISARVFSNAGAPTQSSRRRDAFLRLTLASIGRHGALISQLRDGLLGIGRIVRFVHETAAAWLQGSAAKRLCILERDIASLNDYDVQLTGKTQFLLDATLGFISIEQNNTIKVLAVVSIVGIPPTLIASIYGMNFKGMPELAWQHGYAYGLSLIALSILVPLGLFWRRGWL